MGSSVRKAIRMTFEKYGHYNFFAIMIIRGLETA